MASYMNSPTLYKTAAILFGLVIPGHVAMGAGAVYPFLNRASITKQEDRSAQQGAKNCWDALNTGLFVTALLNWKFARTGGPQSPEEKLMLAASLVTYAINALRYLRVKESTAFIGLTLPTIASTLAYVLQ